MATQITVTGTFVDGNGDVRAGSIEARPTQAFRDSADGISVNRTWADLGALDAAGGFTALMWACTDETIIPGDVEYDFRLTFDDGTVESFRCPIPHDEGATYDLSARPELSGTTRTIYGATIADVNAAVARSSLRNSQQLSRLQVFSHSYGKLGVDAEWEVFHERLAGRLHADLEVNSISGSKLVNSAIQSGGWNHMMRSCPHPWTNYDEDQYQPQRGGWVLITGINDINDAEISGDARYPTCLYDAYRAVISWFSLGAAFNFRQSSGQTFPAGSWSQSEASATVAAKVPEWGYKYSGSTGAKVQVVTDAAATGKVVTLYFVADRVSGGLAASAITFTVDGVATEPIGYEGVTFTTKDRWPSWTTPLKADVGLMAARFALPDDDATHTVVATAGTGGMAYWGYGIEALRPGAVCNIARPLDAGYGGVGSDTMVATVNAELADIVTEFGSPVTLVDMDTVMGKSADAFDDNIHPNPEYQARLADAVYDALASATPATSRKYL